MTKMTKRQADREAMIDRVSRRFDHVLAKWLGAQKLEKVKRENRKETSGLVCHSHDHCDSNLAMFEAMVDCGFSECEILIPFGQGASELMAVWNGAWDRWIQRDCKG